MERWVEMTAQDDVEELIEQFDLAVGEFLKGNPEPAKKCHELRNS